jgi:hypothetical protein
MNINPQFTYDKNGNPIGVFITIDEWSELTNGMQIDLPSWQKDAIDAELRTLETNPETITKWEDFKKEYLA